MKSNPLKSIARFLWYGRSHFYFLDFPLLCRLPHGGWFLARGDEMGLIVFFRLPYENNEQQFVRKFLKPGMTFFDIGANQGLYTLLAAKYVQPEGKVFAFEPLARELNNLKLNALINNFHNIKMESLAMGYREGFVEMFSCLDGKNSYSSLRYPSENVKARKKVIKVPITSLDNYAKRNNIKAIDFIKIDAEGGELDILKGGINVFSELRPVLICEVSDKRTQQWGYSAFQICNFLKKYEYSWFQVEDRGLIQPLKKNNNFDENLIAIPNEKINQILKDV